MNNAKEISIDSRDIYEEMGFLSCYKKLCFAERELNGLINRIKWKL